MSDIPPSGGASRNEGIHKVLNKTLRKSRIGIQFALALGIFFYIWNEKKITATEDQRRIRVTPPIESHFENLESNQDGSGNHHFGITDQDVVLPKTSHSVVNETQSCSVSSIATNPESCRCGLGARKKESNITSFDNFKKRCKCF